jgi:hypothetical protein
MTNVSDPYAELIGALRIDPWATEAACKGRWADLENPENENPARVLCFNCPVENECREWVLGLDKRADPVGIRGGMNPMQRNRARRQRAHAANEAKRANAKSVPVPDKQCRSCEDTKPAAEFYKDPYTRDGLKTDCRTCHLDAERARRQQRALREAS